jgi:hypothetical protein
LWFFLILFVIIFLKYSLKLFEVNCTFSIFINRYEQILIYEFADFNIKLVKAILQLIDIKCSDFILIKMFIWIL